MLNISVNACSNGQQHPKYEEMHITELTKYGNTSTYPEGGQQHLIHIVFILRYQRSIAMLYLYAFIWCSFMITLKRTKSTNKMVPYKTTYRSSTISTMWHPAHSSKIRVFPEIEPHTHSTWYHYTSTHLYPESWPQLQWEYSYNIPYDALWISVDSEPSW